MSATRSIRCVIVALTTVAAAMTMPTILAIAQRGGRVSLPSAGGALPLTRLETLAADFKLSKDQKKAVKALLDDAQKSAGATREALTSSHAAIATAIAAGKSDAEIDGAVRQYAEQAAAMAAVEMKALADVLRALDPDQRANQSAIRSAFFLMRGAFLDNKRWDEVPDSRSY